MKPRDILVALAVMFGPCVGYAAEDACNSLTPALVGGPMLPEDSDTAVIRWLGNANYEVAFGGKVYLSIHITIVWRARAPSALPSLM